MKTELKKIYWAVCYLVRNPVKVFINTYRKYTNRLKRVILLPLGIDITKTLQGMKGVGSYLRDLELLKKQQKSSNIDFPLTSYYPCLTDRYSQSGTASGHYFHQDLFVARKIFQNSPNKHIDAGSRIDGFVAHVATFREIEVLDIRHLTSKTSNIKYTQVDLMSDLNNDLIDYCDSLSCLHALEHFGLGRYADPVNYNGYIVGLNNLNKILKKQGKFYLSVPIGPQRIVFNAHRVFSLEYLLSLVNGNYHIDSFSLVNDEGDLRDNIQLAANEISDNYGCTYGCGILEMTKL